MFSGMPDYNPCRVCKLDHDYYYHEAVQVHRKVLLKEARQRAYNNWFLAPPISAKDYYIYGTCTFGLALLFVLMFYF